MALVQRPLRGSRISTFYPVKSLPSLSSLDSAFQLQEYISLLIRLDVHDVDAIVSIPGRSAKEKGKGKENDSGEDASSKSVTVDEACWKYEQLRRLAQDLSHPLITMLQQVCTRTTCPEMKAGEWLYLCVAHGNDGAMEQCCAIDYILHTLDSATALLNSPRAFPSRLQIPPASHRHFTSLARRLGRIFAHAYFHHREEFEQAEAESSLYARFLALTEKFDLVPADFLVIPPRAVASGSESASADGRRGGVVPMGTEVQPPTLLGAALHVDTNTSASSPSSAVPSGEGAAGEGTSPPGLEGAGAGAGVGADAMSPQSASASASARRYGRSRTDTMMHEGEGRFPPSPASPAADADADEGPTGLDAVLKAAGVGMLPPQAQGHAAAVPQENEKEKEKDVAPEPGQAQSQPESESASAAEPERPELPLAQVAEPEHEPPSPTSDEEQVAAAEGDGMGPIVSPSSSTAPQAGERPIMSMLEKEPASPGGAGVVPTISVEPATPPADGEELEGFGEEEKAGVGEEPKEMEKEKEAKEEPASEPTPAEEAVKEAEAAAPVSAAAVPTEAPATAPVDAETPAPATEAPAPTPTDADEEVDVTDTQKDAEVSPAAQADKPAAKAETEKAEVEKAE
ncbi:Mob1/phocein [Mycena galopus ATCC 62051]|nr:Mob1/phocein [Mycena galopus ATCC 62051]